MFTSSTDHFYHFTWKHAYFKPARNWLVSKKDLNQLENIDMLLPHLNMLFPPYQVIFLRLSSHSLHKLTCVICGYNIPPWGNDLFSQGGELKNKNKNASPSSVTLSPNDFQLFSESFVFCLYVHTLLYTTLLFFFSYV